MRVVIESPYAGDVDDNVRFARAVCRYALDKGVWPLAPHLLYTQMLDDTKPAERDRGIAAGLRWAAVADEAWFCTHTEYVTNVHAAEWSSGMRYALSQYAMQPTVRVFVRTFSWHKQSGVLIPVSSVRIF